MINTRISANWSTTKPIAQFSCTPYVQEVHTRADVVHLTPGLLGLGVLFSIQHRKCIAKHMINSTIFADWSTTKPIAAFSCTPRVQEVYTKAEVVLLTPGLLGLARCTLKIKIIIIFCSLLYMCDNFPIVSIPC